MFCPPTVFFCIFSRYLKKKNQPSNCWKYHILNFLHISKTFGRLLRQKWNIEVTKCWSIMAGKKQLLLRIFFYNVHTKLLQKINLIWYAVSGKWFWYFFKNCVLNFRPFFGLYLVTVMKNYQHEKFAFGIYLLFCN